MRRIIQSRGSDPRNSGNWDRDIEVLCSGPFVGIKITECKQSGGKSQFGFANISLKAAEELMTVLDVITSNPADDA